MKTSNCFVGNLSFKLLECDLQSAFEQYGTVKNCRIITDRETGRSRGFGFVQMETIPEAELAMERLNGTELEGRELNVREAEERPSGRRN